MKILFVTARFPYPPAKGDKIMPYQRLKHLARRHDITLLSFAEGPVSDEALAHIKKHCGEIHLVTLKKYEIAKNILFGGMSGLPLQVLYYRSKEFSAKARELLSSGGYDLIHVFMLRAAQYFVEDKPAPLIVEFIDSMGLNMRRRALTEKGFKKAVFDIEAGRSEKYEREVSRKADAIVVVSEIDKKFIGSENVRVIPLGVDTSIFTPGSMEERSDKTVIFTGNVRYFPNKSAIIHFVENIWPLIRRRVPSAEFHIVGYGAEVLCRLEKRDNDIKIFSSVGDMAEHIRKAAVSVSPMLSGSGMQFKILEALACGTPAVTTSMGKGSIDLGEKDGLFTADDPENFADKVITLIEDKAYRGSLSLAAAGAIRDKYSWEHSNRMVDRLYEDIGTMDKSKQIKGSKT